MSDHEYNERLICVACGIGSEYGEQQGNRNCPKLIDRQPTSKEGK